jgi:hypothetical protein
MDGWGWLQLLGVVLVIGAIAGGRADTPDVLVFCVGVALVIYGAWQRHRLRQRRRSEE